MLLFRHPTEIVAYRLLEKLIIKDYSTAISLLEPRTERIEIVWQNNNIPHTNAYLTLQLCESIPHYLHPKKLC